MKTKKLRWMLIAMTAALAISAVLAASCAPVLTPQVVKETVVVEKEVEVVVTPTPAPLPEGGVKTIPFMTTESDPESVALFQEIIAEYEAEHPDVRIDLVLTAHGSEEERLITASACGGRTGCGWHSP